MVWRKWLVRGLVFSVAGGWTGGALLYQHLTNPAAVRQQVLDKLAAHFTGANISLGSAHMSLFGGIKFTDLRMTRRDDLDKADFLYVPSGVIYHDKEHLLAGKLVVRQLWLDRPVVRARRNANGNWNLTGILGPVDPREHIPMIVFRQGTVILEDQRSAPGTPPVEIKKFDLDVINDPLLILTIKGSGDSDVLGTVQMHGSWHRTQGDIDASITAAAIPVGSSLLQQVASFCPDLAGHARQLEGIGRLELHLSHHPRISSSWNRRITFGLTQGSFRHALLPLPLDQIKAEVQYVDGHIPQATLQARAAGARIRMDVKDLRLPCDQAPRLACETTKFPCSKLDLAVEHLTITDELFQRLPEKFRDINILFKPRGPINLTYSYQNESPQRWRQRFLIQPENMEVLFAGFPYPLNMVHGSLDYRSKDGEPGNLQINLMGQASGKNVYVRGDAAGEKPNHRLSLNIFGRDIVLDEQLIQALPAKYRSIVHSLHPTGFCDFHVTIFRDPQTQKYANRFITVFHHASLQYSPFSKPYPGTSGDAGSASGPMNSPSDEAVVSRDTAAYKLEDVGGILDIQPDHWEFRDFQGIHKGGKFFTQGRSYKTPNGNAVSVYVRGSNILLDDDLRNAMDASVQQTWRKFLPAGRMDFEGTVTVPPGAPFTAKPDIDLTVFPRGCTIQPDFFRYGLSDLRGKVHYVGGIITLENLQARHGYSLLSLEGAEVKLHPRGGFSARLDHLRGTPLMPDDEFVRALPPVLGKVCRALSIQSPLEVHMQQVKINTFPEPGRAPWIYWDGGVALRDATLRTGVPLQHLTGEIACRGTFNGQQLTDVTGNLFFQEAIIFRQPFKNIKSRIVVSEEDPETLQMPGLQANLFGGTLNGDLRVEFTPTLQYALNLTASQVNLGEFSRYNLGNKSDIKGQAFARLFLTGQGRDNQHLHGKGQIDVPDGKMYNLPLLLNLIKFLGLRLPDRTAFEEAHAEFGIEGTKIHVKQLELLGDAISLTGQGDINLNAHDFHQSNLNLEFSVDPARVTRVLPSVVRVTSRQISNQLFKIRMSGPMSKPRLEPLPPFVGLLRKVWDGNDRPGS